MNKIKIKIISLIDSNRRAGLKDLYKNCNFPVEIFDAFKPEINFVEKYDDTFDFKFFRYKYNSDIKRGELGCLFSHLKIYNELVSQNKYDHFLVCEDDAIPNTKVFEILENMNLSDIDILSFYTVNGYVGKGKKIECIDTKSKEYILYPVKYRFDSTVCYLISRSAALKILKEKKHSSTADWPDVAFTTNFYYSGLGFCKLQDVESEIGIIRRNQTTNLNRINNIFKCPKVFFFNLKNWLLPAIIRRYNIFGISHVQNK